jgi:hypothetical protein
VAIGLTSRSFNLTEQDTVLQARVNYYYAKERGRQLKPTNVAGNVYIAAGQPPFTRKTYCQKVVVPRNNSIAMMTFSSGCDACTGRSS